MLPQIQALSGVAGVNVVSAEWLVLGPDFGHAPDVNTKQYWVTAGVR